MLTPEQRAAEVHIVVEDHGDMTCADWRVNHVETEKNIADAIREAVASERERCAEVADGVVMMLVGHANHDYGHNAEALAADIAAAIREVPK